MPKYNPKEIEPKFIQKWRESKIYETPELSPEDKKYYSLYSFPYPSGSGLHVGHAEGMVANDIMARYFRMKGHKVLFPMGWDSFGLPAENFAIKTGTPPQESTENAIKNFIAQIDRLGISVDWQKELGTHRPDYYKWTQWIFLELFKKGLAYKKNAPVNWCPSCQTVLANEQVVDGKCERCDTDVTQKDMDQWFFKITDYADRLDNDLSKVDWPNGTKQQQRNWIGKSEGTRVKFGLKFNGEVSYKNTESDNSLVEDRESVEKLIENNNLLLGMEKDSQVVLPHPQPLSKRQGGEVSLEIFTTRLDTIYGATFCVVAPEHKLLNVLKSKISNWAEVSNYINQAKNKTDLERQTQKEKTGIEVKGVMAVNPFNDQEIPIFVADYVLGGYGTGAIMAVPAHDERDMEFALKYGVDINEVIAKEYGIRKDPHEFVDGISAVVFNKSNCKYLVLRWPSGMGTLIGGGKDDGESNYGALVRELKEEVGIVRILDDYTVVEEFYSNYFHKVKKFQRRGRGSFHLVVIDDSCIDPSKLSKESHEQFQVEWRTAQEMLQDIINIGDNDHWVYGVKRAVIKNIDIGNELEADRNKFEYKPITDYGILFNSKHPYVDICFTYIVPKSLFKWSFHELKSKLKTRFLNLYDRQWQGTEIVEVADYYVFNVFGMDPQHTDDLWSLFKEAFANKDSQQKFFAISHAEKKIIVLNREELDIAKTNEVALNLTLSKEELISGLPNEVIVLIEKIETSKTLDFCGQESQDAIQKMQSWLEENNLGNVETTYRLRDWLVSRQRYWGAPIPIIFSPKAKEEGFGYIPREKLNILFLHGFGSTGDEGWRTPMIAEMNKLGHKVFAPNLPNSISPDFFEWFNFIEANYKELLQDGKKLVVIGHSLGGLLASKLAEKYSFAKLILLAPSPNYISDTIDLSVYPVEYVSSLKKFFEASGDIDSQAIKQNIAEIVIINSTDDYLIDVKTQDYYKQKFQEVALIRDFEGFGHFSSSRDNLEVFVELYPFVNLKNNSDYPGIFPVNETNLPVLLPEDVDFKPTGESPIKLSKTFNQGVVCPIFGTPATREADTMDTFVDSSWYFLRYTDVHNSEQVFDIQSMMPEHHSQNNEKVKELIKEVAILAEEFRYAFIGSVAVAILNGKPHREIPDIDLMIETKHVESFVKKLVAHGYEYISTESNDYSSSDEEKIYKYKKDGVEVEICNFTWDTDPSFEERYFEGKRVFIEPFENIYKHASERNYTDTINFLNSFKTKTNTWSPADIYMIGTEHTVMHLLYARFFTKFLFDQGYINFDEPFPKMRHMGLILGPDSRKMSKRWGNVINPLDEIEKYSADTLRMYEMFMGPYEDAKPWNDRAENGVMRFLSRVCELADRVEPDFNSNEQKVEVNDLIQKISKDIESLSYNTAVAKFMEFSNFLQKQDEIEKDVWIVFLKLMAPFAPFITEELWANLGFDDSIHQQPWPEFDPTLTKQENIKIAVQINGKVRGTLEVDSEKSQDELLKLAQSHEQISKHIYGEIKKVIYVKNKLLSLVV